MSKTFTSYLESPIGSIELITSEDAVLSAEFKDESQSSDQHLPEIAIQLQKQLKDYFEGNLLEFNLKLNPQGTDFQKRVWQELTNIPFGKNTSYMDMAVKLGDPKVIRAAAAANGKNPISIIIPCHRVIGKDGSLTGYAGGLHRKKWLLDHENRLANGVLELF
ncbi:methylated-DNA--[protein]-cysteine S-methyltransferase [Arcticibacterium luteifluviistationis]|uniref:Methylated-DNA--protein-cysteine methyltransferase n=1 Tax=Arcticibacterium luteifluviistationis TaxID=1784714 RepID=A0A2Z4GG34_9BACT|nr:methylated-DNA--[protein]-cysteine S-methyltransferase [Arcticibacterium luteifluviistationis]AWV99958.1 cysteine methyltransferase [Arcticibacterium luteifluviistationis]